MTNPFTPRRATGIALTLMILSSLPLASTPPTPAYRRLELRAEADGASAVRAEYRREIEALLSVLRGREEQPSIEASLRRNLTLSWLFEYLGSWAYVEAREGRLSPVSESAQELADASADLLAAAASSQELYIEATSELDDAWRRTDPGVLARLGLKTSPNRSLAINRDFALRYVALLGKVTGDRAMVQRVFDISGGEIDTCRSADEFLALRHDIDGLLSISAVPEVAKVAPALSSAEEAAVHALVTSFFEAVVRRDVAALEPLFSDRETARALAATWTTTDLLSVDLSEARFEIRRLEAERWSVRIGNVGAVRLKSGRPKKSLGSKTFEVSLRDGRAQIVSVGGGR